jgi:chondroitin-sulfate-ABC endolyase/exolyase
MKKITTVLSTTEKSNAHFKHGNSSLAWQWSPGGVLQIDHPIGYLTPEQSGITDRIPVFVVWIYNEKALPGKTVRFLFQTGETANCWFDFGLDFTGWRAGWVAYDRDMQGTPQPGMDRLVIKDPNNTQGKLFFDHILFTAYTDSRFPMADHQLPYLNPNAWDHWLILYKQSQNQFDIPVNKQLTESELSNIRQIEERVYEKITPPVKSRHSDLEPIKTEYESYKIKKNSGGITGLPIWYIYHSQLYLPDNDTLRKIKSEGLDLQKYTTFMGQIARAYTASTDPKTKNKLSEYFIHLTEHLLDQGFQSGSSTGTLSHSGYALRNFYTSLFLMKEVLTEAGLASEAQKAMEWLSGVAEVKAAPKVKGISADAFNTSVMGRLLSILMLPDTPEKATYLKAFSRYINNGLMHADGLEDFLKPDGSVFHHASLFPAYAIGGFDGATLMVWLLSHTPFAVSAEAHQNLKRALLMMRLYCNLKQWPLSLSARHPNGNGELHPNHYAQLALAGSPDGTEPVDTELARAYLRLSQHDKPDQFTRI